MANLVKLFADQVSFPLWHLQYSLTPPIAKLQDGLNAYQQLKLDPDLQGLRGPQRQEITRFLRQFGQLLFHNLFSPQALQRLDVRTPLLLELGVDWAAYPWELLNDGKQWLGLRPGVVRYLFHPDDAGGRPRPPPGPLKVLGASARPVPIKPDSALSRQAQALGPEFISSYANLLDGSGDRWPDHALRNLEHTTVAALEDSLALGPDVLLFSGFANDQGWFLETERLAPQHAAWDWVLTRIRQAARERLRLVVLNDSPGFGAPRSAAAQARDLLRAGVTAVIRMEGRQERPREQDYLRTLLRFLGQGHTVRESHLAAVQRLYRRSEDGWDWGFVRLYEKMMPSPDDPAFSFSDDAGGRQTAPSIHVSAEVAARLRAFASLPPPPVFAGSRSFLARGMELKRLADALQPEPAQKSPLVFLTGPAGSGKTMLAMEAAQRLHQRFQEVVYLHDRDLPPDPFDVAAPQGISPNGHPQEWPLVTALARQLRAREVVQTSPPRWRIALNEHCEDGTARLIILDRLEHMPGYEAFCEGLAGLPRVCRVLVLSRGHPPLVPAEHIRLEPLSVDGLEQMFSMALRERLEAFPDDGTLLRSCCGDLFAARLLREADAWPSPREVATALESSGDNPEGGVQGGRLLRLLLGRTLESLSGDGRETLKALTVFPALVHREVVAQLSGLENRRLSAALAELRDRGLIDSYEGDRYHALHPRVHAAVSRQVLNRSVLAQLQPRLLRAYQSYLTTLRVQIQEHRRNRRHRAPPLSAWTAQVSADGYTGNIREWQRLAVERINAAEVVTLLTEDGEWRAVERLVNEADFLEAVPETGDAWMLLNHCLLKAGEARGDSVLQALALNRLAGLYLRASPGTEPPAQLERARLLLERALDLLGQAAGWQIMGETYRLLSHCYEQMGQVDVAVNLLYSAVELAQQLDQPEALVQSCAALQRIWAVRGEDIGMTESYLRSRMAYLRHHEHRLEAATTERILADALMRAGRSEEAYTGYRAVLEQTRALGASRQTALTLLCLADYHATQGQAHEALAQWSTAAEEFGAELEPDEQRPALEKICQVLDQGPHPQQTLEAYLLLRGLLEEAGHRHALIAVLDRMGGLYYQLGQQTQSTQCYQERLKLQTSLSPS